VLWAEPPTHDNFKRRETDEREREKKEKKRKKKNLPHLYHAFLLQFLGFSIKTRGYLLPDNNGKKIKNL